MPVRQGTSELPWQGGLGSTCGGTWWRVGSARKQLCQYCEWWWRPVGPRAELGNEVTTESDFCTTLLNFTDELLIPPTVTTHPADMTLMPFVACGNGAALLHAQHSPRTAACGSILTLNRKKASSPYHHGALQSQPALLCRLKCMPPSIFGSELSKLIKCAVSPGATNGVSTVSIANRGKDTGRSAFGGPS